jgi:Spy/CpxP family protein refolding chaperone
MAFWRIGCTVALAALLAIAATKAPSQAQPSAPYYPRGMGGQPPLAPAFDREALFSRLNLTPQQRTQLINLMNETQEKIRQLLTKLHEQRMQLLQLYQQYQFEERTAQRLIQNINQTQADLLKVHHENQKQLRRILEREQFEQWNQWWKERMFFAPPKGEWERRKRGGKLG